MDEFFKICISLRSCLQHTYPLFIRLVFSFSLLCFFTLCIPSSIYITLRFRGYWQFTDILPYKHKMPPFYKKCFLKNIILKKALVASCDLIAIRARRNAIFLFKQTAELLLIQIANRIRNLSDWHQSGRKQFFCF